MYFVWMACWWDIARCPCWCDDDDSDDALNDDGNDNDSDDYGDSYDDAEEGGRKKRRNQEQQERKKEEIDVACAFISGTDINRSAIRWFVYRVFVSGPLLAQIFAVRRLLQGDPSDFCLMGFETDLPQELGRALNKFTWWWRVVSMILVE